MKKFVVGLMMLATILGGVFASVPAMAADGNGAAILQTCWNEAQGEDGAGIVCVLKLVVDVLTVGVGVLGVLGIVISGIQYLTSGGNEEQMRKAKRRLFEIVIGLVAYVLIYAVLTWLLPGFGGTTTS